MTSVDTDLGRPGGVRPAQQHQRPLLLRLPLTPRNSGYLRRWWPTRSSGPTRTHQGLNPLKIYTESDYANPISLSVLVSRMTAYINNVAPGLLTTRAGGQLQEVIPYGDGMWRGFVDVGGVTQDYVDISGNSNVTPRLGTVLASSASQGSGSAGPPPSAAGPGCGGNPARMPASQLAKCIQQFAAALSRREQSPAPAPSPAGSPSH